MEGYGGNCTGLNTRTYMTTIRTLVDVIYYVAWALGIPGNILSAIVWLRRHVTSKSSSAIYLAALAINDLAYLVIHLVYYVVRCRGGGWFCIC